MQLGWSARRQARLPNVSNLLVNLAFDEPCRAVPKPVTPDRISAEFCSR
jgi:hypothetical protein